MKRCQGCNNVVPDASAICSACGLQLDVNPLSPNPECSAPMDRREERHLKFAEKLFMEDGDASKAFELLEPLYHGHKNDALVRKIYLMVCSELYPDKVDASVRFDRLQDMDAQIILVDLAVSKGELGRAVALLKNARSTFGEHQSLRLKDVELDLEEFRLLKDEQCLEDAADVFQKMQIDENNEQHLYIRDYLSYCRGCDSAIRDGYEACKRQNLTGYYHRRLLKRLGESVSAGFPERFCGGCGMKLEDGERFCGSCGLKSI